LIHLMVYVKLMLARLLKKLNNVKSCTPLNALTLNHNHNPLK
jgi:hypothetical protein